MSNFILRPLALFMIPLFLIATQGNENYLQNLTILYDMNLKSVYGQSINSSNIFVPSNMNSIAITLKNDQSSDSTYLLDSPLLIGLISAGSAILGGVLGSFMTNRSNRQMEEMRYDREKEREDDLQADQEKRNEEYKHKVTTLTYLELKKFSAGLARLQDESFWSSDEYRRLKIVKSSVESYKMEFLDIPYDIRLRLYPPEILYAVQRAYDVYQAFMKILIPLIEEKTYSH